MILPPACGLPRIVQRAPPVVNKKMAGILWMPAIVEFAAGMAPQNCNYFTSSMTRNTYDDSSHAGAIDLDRRRTRTAAARWYGQRLLRRVVRMCAA
jgi:hypothetical protein